MSKAEKVRTDVRREIIIEKLLPRICDEYCRFPKLVKNQYAMDQICESCPTQVIEKYITEEKENGAD